ncbi:TIGR02391 family protein [Halomarina salina]|uniref:TIGR02391 family protein n=1 Tax=Halomarina salina TaxID=1872699 RepID=A0ABD5RL55_9EURY
MREDMYDAAIGHNASGAYFLFQGQYREPGYNGSRWGNRKVLHITTDDVDWFREAEEVLSRALGDESGTTFSRRISPLEGTFKESDDEDLDEETEFEEIEMTVNRDGFHIDCYSDGSIIGSAYIPRSPKNVDGEYEDNSHLEALHFNISQLIDSFEQGGDDEEVEIDTEMSLAGLDEELQSRCLPAYRSNQYSDAAKTAVQIVEERISGLEISELDGKYGKDLMMAAFTEDDGPLSLGENRNEKQGVMFMFAGGYQAIRNPLSHRQQDSDQTRHMDQIDQRMAHDVIAYSNLLLNLLESAVRRRESELEAETE